MKKKLDCLIHLIFARQVLNNLALSPRSEGGSLYINGVLTPMKGWAYRLPDRV